MAFIPYVLTKGIGLASIGYTLVDAHNYGKINADQYSAQKDAQYGLKYLNNTVYLNSPSYIQNQIRELSFEHELDSKYFHSINKPKGYLRGFTYMLMDKMMPLALGLGALILPFRKGKISKILSGLCALASAVIVGKECMHSYFAVGAPNIFKQHET